MPKYDWRSDLSKIDVSIDGNSFTEKVSVNNPIMNLFAGLYLKKQQSLYIADLKKELGE